MKSSHVLTDDFIRDYCYVKSGVSYEEYFIHRNVYNMDIIRVPKILAYDEDTGVMIMQKIPNMCVADWYGESVDSVPADVFEKIREAITLLYVHRIQYVDITGYNFIEHGGHIWVIDFGHATAMTVNTVPDEFLVQFMGGLVSWNPDFA